MMKLPVFLLVILGCLSICSAGPLVLDKVLEEVDHLVTLVPAVLQGKKTTHKPPKVTTPVAKPSSAAAAETTAPQAPASSAATEAATTHAAASSPAATETTTTQAAASSPAVAETTTPHHSDSSSAAPPAPPEVQADAPQRFHGPRLERSVGTSKENPGKEHEGQGHDGQEHDVQNQEGQEHDGQKQEEQEHDGQKQEGQEHDGQNQEEEYDEEAPRSLMHLPTRRKMW